MKKVSNQRHYYQIAGNKFIYVKLFYIDLHRFIIKSHFKSCQTRDEIHVRSTLQMMSSLGYCAAADPDRHVNVLSGSGVIFMENKQKFSYLICPKKN